MIEPVPESECSWPGNECLQTIVTLLEQQDWCANAQQHKHSGGQNSATGTAGCVQLRLSAAGYERVHAHGIASLQEAYADLLKIHFTDLPIAGPLPRLEFCQAAEMQAYALPDVPEFSSVRYWLKEPHRQLFLLEVAADWPVFQGHFPHTPILAGIVQLHWAARFAHLFEGRNEIPSEVRQLKFRNVFIPPGWLELELQTTAADQLSFQFSSLAGIHAQGRLHYGH